MSRNLNIEGKIDGGSSIYNNSRAQVAHHTNMRQQEPLVLVLNAKGELIEQVEPAPSSEVSGKGRSQRLCRTPHCCLPLCHLGLCSPEQLGRVSHKSREGGDNK